MSYRNPSWTVYKTHYLSVTTGLRETVGSCSRSSTRLPRGGHAQTDVWLFCFHGDRLPRPWWRRRASGVFRSGAASSCEGHGRRGRRTQRRLSSPGPRGPAWIHASPRPHGGHLLSCPYGCPHTRFVRAPRTRRPRPHGLGRRRLHAEARGERAGPSVRPSICLSRRIRGETPLGPLRSHAGKRQAPDGRLCLKRSPSVAPSLPPTVSESDAT